MQLLIASMWFPLATDNPRKSDAIVFFSTKFRISDDLKTMNSLEVVESRAWSET